MPPLSKSRVSPAAPDNVSIALRVLAWALGEDARAARLLALTGLEPADLRARAGDPALLAAAIGFVAGHEPDLVACATAIDETPEAIAAAGRNLGA